MREIKFRAWDADSESFIYSDKESAESFFEFRHGVLRGFVLVEVGATIDEPAGCEAEELDNIQQFTGLLDKNGKEIYEGDIVRGYPQKPKNHIDTEVAWDEPAARWFLGDWYEGEFPDTEKESAVIGNIYENPELLNPVKQ